MCFMALPLCIFLFHLKKREEDDLFAGFSYFRNGFLFKKKILDVILFDGFWISLPIFLTFSNFYLKFFLGGFSCF